MIEGVGVKPGTSKCGKLLGCEYHPEAGKSGWETSCESKQGKQKTGGARTCLSKHPLATQQQQQQKEGRKYRDREIKQEVKVFHCICSFRYYDIVRMLSKAHPG